MCVRRVCVCCLSLRHDNFDTKCPGHRRTDVDVTTNGGNLIMPCQPTMARTTITAVNAVYAGDGALAQRQHESGIFCWHRNLQSHYNPNHDM